MTTSLNLKYNITFNAATKVIDTAGELSEENTIQQQSQYSSNSLINPAVKRIEVSLLPTPSSTPLSTRVYDLDLNTLQVEYLRVIHIKSEKQFLISMADTSANIGSTPRVLARNYVLDTGLQPNPLVFTPDQPYPKFIRLINPLEINGGGTGNDVTDLPIIVSMFLVSVKETTA